MEKIKDALFDESFRLQKRLKNHCQSGGSGYYPLPNDKKISPYLDRLYAEKDLPVMVSTYTKSFLVVPGLSLWESNTYMEGSGFNMEHYFSETGQDYSNKNPDNPDFLRISFDDLAKSDSENAKELKDFFAKYIPEQPKDTDFTWTIRDYFTTNRGIVNVDLQDKASNIKMNVKYRMEFTNSSCYFPEDFCCDGEREQKPFPSTFYKLDLHEAKFNQKLKFQDDGTLKASDTSYYFKLSPDSAEKYCKDHGKKLWTLEQLKDIVPMAKLTKGIEFVVKEGDNKICYQSHSGNTNSEEDEDREVLSKAKCGYSYFRCM